MRNPGLRKEAGTEYQPSTADEKTEGRRLVKVTSPWREPGLPPRGGALSGPPRGLRGGCVWRRRWAGVGVGAWPTGAGRPQASVGAGAASVVRPEVSGDCHQ